MTTAIYKRKYKMGLRFQRFRVHDGGAKTWLQGQLRAHTFTKPPFHCFLFREVLSDVLLLLHGEFQLGENS